VTEDELRELVDKLENATLDNDAKEAMLRSMREIALDRHYAARIDALRDPDKAAVDAFHADARAKGWLSEPIGITGVFDDYANRITGAQQDEARVLVVVVQCAASPCDKRQRRLALIYRTSEGILFELVQDWHAATKLIESEWPEGQRVPEVTTESWLLLDDPHPDPARRNPWVTCPTHGRLELPVGKAITLARSRRQGASPARLRVSPRAPKQCANT
jgi:hypothetical protein